MTNVDMSSVVPVANMSGEDEEETGLLHQMYVEASQYVEGFDWCLGVLKAYMGLGVPGVVAVFLFHIDAPSEVDRWLWVVVGDLPFADLVTDQAIDLLSALKVYCDLMDEWVRAARGGKTNHEVFPVKGPQDAKHAEMVAKRVELLRTEIIPVFGT